MLVPVIEGVNGRRASDPHADLDEGVSSARPGSARGGAPQLEQLRRLRWSATRIAGPFRRLGSSGRRRRLGAARPWPMPPPSPCSAVDSWASGREPGHQASEARLHPDVDELELDESFMQRRCRR